MDVALGPIYRVAGDRVDAPFAVVAASAVEDAEHQFRFPRQVALDRFARHCGDAESGVVVGAARSIVP